MLLSNARREKLADAALTVLAREGSRGLTHRAVDRCAGVSEGTTSYYFRTRRTLLDAAVQRLAHSDTETILAAANSQEGLIEMLVRSVMNSDGSIPPRQLARLELTLESQRYPALRQVLTKSGQEIHNALTHALQLLFVRDPAERATALLVTVDGLLIDRLAGEESRAGDAEAVRTVLREVLTVRRCAGETA